MVDVHPKETVTDIDEGHISAELFLQDFIEFDTQAEESLNIRCRASNLAGENEAVMEIVQPVSPEELELIGSSLVIPGSLESYICRPLYFSFNSPPISFEWNIE